MKRLVTYIMVLVVLTCCTTQGEYEAMLRGLDSINQCNRNDVPFTVADVEPYVDFFDRHGKPNDRLLARYLLGRAYYENGEAPIALQCYHQAIECADTTDENCDFKQLSRVYGQMALIFYDQGLYRQQLDYERLAERCAWTGKDTLAALMYYEQQSVAFRELGKMDSSILIAKNVAQKYFQFHYNTDAAIALGSITRTLLNKDSLVRARQYIAIYEEESGLFDKNGNIQNGREAFYHIKGLLCFKEQKLDSSEYWFRKELQDGKDFNNQNGAALGLAMLYEERHIPDSTAKYYHYAYAMNDSMYARMATNTVERMQSMYDYSRHQEKALLEEKKSSQRAVIIWICIGIVIIISLLTYIIIKKLNRKKIEAEQRYLKSQNVIEQAQRDLSMLRVSEEANRELISEKEQTIREQETVMKALLKRNSTSQSMADRALKNSDVYNKFRQLSVIGQQPTPEEWLLIEQQIYHYYPGLKEFIKKHENQLNDKERKTCLLIRADFKPQIVSHMLGVAPSYISSIRTDMLQKLFCLSGNPKAFDKMMKEIY